jgi:hypothetical protein
MIAVQRAQNRHKKGVRNLLGPLCPGIRSGAVGAKKVPDTFFVFFVPVLKKH